MNRVRLTAFASLAMLILSGQTVGDEIAADTEQSPRTTGRLIVHYADSAYKLPPVALAGFYRKRASSRHQAGLKLVRELGYAHELLAPAHAMSASELTDQANLIASQPGVVSASPEYWRKPLLTPNDPLYQPGASPADQTYLYDGIYSFQAPDAWDTTTGSSAVVIAIVDTGYLPQHPALTDRAAPNVGYDFVSADSPAVFDSANDGDGRDSDPIDPGDRCGESQTPSSWHGTGVASVAAAAGNDAEGMVGIDWSARLLHVRALGECGGTDADIIDALRWSAGLTVNGVPHNPFPASVINVSLGGATECTIAWQEAIDDVTAAGAVVVMAAGNGANNALRNSPSNCSDVVSVGSSSPGGSIDTGFSNYGLKMTVAAPGRNLVIASNSGFDAADENGNEYISETGTSFSAALVSGLIGLIKSLNADFTPAQIVSILQDSATAFAPGNCDDFYCGGGIANMTAPVELATRFAGTGQNREQSLLSSTAAPLPLDLSTSASLGGFRDMQYFAIDVPQAGMLSVSSDSDTNLYGYLLNPRLSTRAIDEQSGQGLNFLLTARVQPGTHYVAVERRTHNARMDSQSEFSLLATLLTEEPDAFALAPVVDATPSSVIASEVITISGLQVAVPMLISNGRYSLNGGEASDAPTRVDNGDTVVVFVQSAEQPLSTHTARLDIGAFSASFAVTTRSNIGEGGSGGGGCSIGTGTQAFDPMLSMLAAVAGLSLLYRRRRQPAPSTTSRH